MNDKRLLSLDSKKGQMARRIVNHCIRVLTVSAVWAMVLETIAAAFHVDIDLSDTLTFIGGVFGGELLMLLIKRLLGKPTDKEEFES